MAHTHGIITAPVVVPEDTQAVFGYGDGDFGTIITNARADGKINIMSYRKPTDYTGWDSGADQPKGSISAQGYADFGISIYSIRTAALSSLTYNTAMNLGLNASIPSETAGWNYRSASKYRIRDFDGYVPFNTGVYPVTYSDCPYEYYILPDFREANHSITVRCGIRLNFDDYELGYGHAGAEAKLLGIGNLLTNIGASSVDLHPGFLAYVKGSGRHDNNNNIVMLYVSSSTFSSSTKEINFEGTFDNISCTGNVVSLDTNFSASSVYPDTIEYRPVLVRVYVMQTGGVWQYTVHPLNFHSYPIGYGQKDIPSFDANYIAPGYDARGGASITYTALVDDGRTYFYINNASDFSLRTSSTAFDRKIKYFGNRPIAIGARKTDTASSEFNFFLTSSILYPGTFDGFRKMWSYNETRDALDATSLSGWSASADPRTRVGTIELVKTSPGATETFYLLKDAVSPFGNSYERFDKRRTGAINLATLQTGDRFTISNPES